MCINKCVFVFVVVTSNEQTLIYVFKHPKHLCNYFLQFGSVDLYLFLSRIVHIYSLSSRVKQEEGIDNLKPLSFRIDDIYTIVR